MADPAFLVTRKELAQLLNVSERMVTKLRERGMDRRTPMQWHIGDVVQFLYQGEGPGQDGPDLTQARTDLAVAQKAKIDLELAERNKHLLPTDEVHLVYLQLATTLTDAVQALPARLAPVVLGLSERAAAEAAIEQECHHVLDDAAESVRRFEDDYSPRRGLSDTPAEAGPGPVGRPEPAD